MQSVEITKQTNKLVCYILWFDFVKIHNRVDSSVLACYVLMFLIQSNNIAHIHSHCSSIYFTCFSFDPLIYRDLCLLSLFCHFIPLTVHLSTSPTYPHPHLLSCSCIQKKGGGEKGDEVSGVGSGEQEKPPTPVERTAPFPHHRWLPSIPPALRPSFFLQSSLQSSLSPHAVPLFLLKGTV